MKYKLLLLVLLYFIVSIYYHYVLYHFFTKATYYPFIILIFSQSFNLRFKGCYLFTYSFIPIFSVVTHNPKYFRHVHPHFRGSLLHFCLYYPIFFIHIFLFSQSIFYYCFSSLLSFLPFPPFLLFLLIYSF